MQFNFDLSDMAYLSTVKQLFFVTWMWSPVDSNLLSLCLEAASLLVPETFRSKVLII